MIWDRKELLTEMSAVDLDVLQAMPLFTTWLIFC